MMSQALVVGVGEIRGWVKSKPCAPNPDSQALNPLQTPQWNAKTGWGFRSDGQNLTSKLVVAMGEIKTLCPKP